MKRTLICMLAVLFTVGIFLVTSGCCCNPADIQVIKDKHMKAEKDFKAQLAEDGKTIDAKNNEIMMLKAEVNKWSSYHAWLSDQTSTVEVPHPQGVVIPASQF